MSNSPKPLDSADVDQCGECGEDFANGAAGEADEDVEAGGAEIAGLLQCEVAAHRADLTGQSDRGGAMGRLAQ